MTNSVKHSIPQYLLFTEVSTENNSPVPRWRFILDQINGDEQFEVSDFEEGASIERLQLLSIIRGLEAIDEPAQVTIVTSSQYVSRGIKQGMHQWRQNQWKWEKFGEMIPIRDCDLWKKIQRATSVHRVDCRFWKMGSNSAGLQARTEDEAQNNRPVRQMQPLKHIRLLPTYIQAWLASCLASIKSHVGQFKLQSPIYRVSAD